MSRKREYRPRSRNQISLDYLTDYRRPRKSWYVKKPPKPILEVTQVVALTAGGRHAWCKAIDGRMVRKALGSIPKHVLDRHSGF